MRNTRPKAKQTYKIKFKKSKSLKTKFHVDFRAYNYTFLKGLKYLFYSIGIDTNRLNYKRLIEDLIQENELEKAFEIFIDSTLVSNQKQLRNDIILLKAKYTNYQRQKRAGLLSSQEIELNFGQIVYSLLGCLNEYKLD